MIIFLGNDQATKLFTPIIRKSKEDIDKDIVVSFNYRFKVPQSLLQSHTCVNIHTGRLPEYGGANPVYWQMRKREQYAGVTLHYMDSGFDTGDIIDTQLVEIHNKTAKELHEQLMKEGLELFEWYYRYILADTAPRTPQDRTKQVFYKSNLVDFNKIKHVDNLEEINMVSYEGKQNPIITVNNRQWEVIPYKE